MKLAQIAFVLIAIGASGAIKLVIGATWANVAHLICACDYLEVRGNRHSERTKNFAVSTAA